MKYPCYIIKDLLPLYIDDVVSKETKEEIKEHLTECEACKKCYDDMNGPVKCEQAAASAQFQTQQINSIQSVNKKNKKSKKTVGIIALTIGLALGILFILYVLPLLVIMGGLLFDAKSSSVQVFEDAGAYNSCFGDTVDNEYGSSFGGQFGVFPRLKHDANVEEFKYTYYNPWDAQYLSYLTVNYTDEEYNEELSRLDQIGVEDYKDLYSVTGAPDGYKLLAMDSDEYSGFVYAMVPEKENNSITYVGIVFCNYFLDIDAEEYIPESYLLEGFDASENNPYRKTMLKN